MHYKVLNQRRTEIENEETRKIRYQPSVTILFYSCYRIHCPRVFRYSELR